MNERRRNEIGKFRLMGEGKDCPHPEKLAYRDKTAAKKGLKRNTAGLTALSDMRPYKCVCGAYHLGHKMGRRSP